MGNNDRHIKEVIDELLQVYRLSSKLEEVKLMQYWPQVVGKIIHKHTRSLFIKKGVLFVSLDSAVIRNELTFARFKLIERLNELMGKEIIHEIVLR